MKIWIKAIALGVVVTGLTACGVDSKSGAGFTLPEGNAEQGKLNYISYGCNACHSHADVPQLEPGAGTSVVIGGESRRVRTYGELVTSVINPSHRVAHRSSDAVADEAGNSKMATFNDVMTVTELVDLVAFLESSYKLSPYSNTAYPIYWHPDMKGEKK